MRIRLSELRSVVRQVIVEAAGFDLTMATYNGQLVVTNGSQILLPGVGNMPQMPKGLTQPGAPGRSSLKFLGISATGDILNAFDPKGVEALRNIGSDSIKYPNNAGRAA